MARQTWRVLGGVMCLLMAGACVFAVDEQAVEPGTEVVPDVADGVPVDPPIVEQPAGSFEQVRDQASYLIGLNIGMDLRRDLIEINPDKVAAGIRDAVSGNTPNIDMDQARQVMLEFQRHMILRLQEVAAKNKVDGEAFLAANKQREGVITLESGLQYEVIKEGDGPMPVAADRISAHYRGSLIDGKQFDSSYDRNQPLQIPVSGVIPAWTEALQKMKVGSKWKLYVPSELAYGPEGAGGDIGPNAVLIFEIELVSIDTAQASQ